VLLVWNRLILPNGRSIVLERQPGADTQGYAGLEDGVDYHWWDLAKAAGLSTLLSVGRNSPSMTRTGFCAPSAMAARTPSMMPAADRPPPAQRRADLTIRPGFPVRVIVTRDLVLEPYGG
jgi:type IV secretion system protein VirB10